MTTATEPRTTTTDPKMRLLTPAFLAVSFAALAYFVADGMALPIYPTYVHGPLLADDVALGMVFGAFSVTALVLRPWAGATADRVGRRPLLIGGAALFAVGMLGHLVAFTVPLLIVTRLVLGAAEAFFFVAALTVVSDLSPEDRRGEALSYASLSIYGGVALGPLIGELVLGEDRFAAAWLAAAAMAGVATLLAWRVPETRPEQSEAEIVAAASVLGWRRFIHPLAVIPGLVVLAGTWGMGGFFAFVKRYGESIGMDAAAPVFFVFAAVVIGLRAGLPWLPDRVGRRRVTGVGLISEAVGLTVIGLFPGVVGLMVGVALFAFGVAFLFPALVSMAVGRVPAAERGSLVGTMSAFIDLGFGLGPVVLGFIAVSAGYPATFLVSAASAVVGLVVLLILLPAGQPVTAREVAQV